MAVSSSHSAIPEHNANTPTRSYLSHQKPKQGRYEVITAVALGAALLVLGTTCCVVAYLQANHVISLLSNPSWLLTYYGCVGAAGVGSGIFCLAGGGVYYFIKRRQEVDLNPVAANTQQKPDPNLELTVTHESIVFEGDVPQPGLLPPKPTTPSSLPLNPENPNAHVSLHGANNTLTKTRESLTPTSSSSTIAADANEFPPATLLDLTRSLPESAQDPDSSAHTLPLQEPTHPSTHSSSQHLAIPSPVILQGPTISNPNDAAPMEEEDPNLLPQELGNTGSPTSPVLSETPGPDSRTPPPPEEHNNSMPIHTDLGGNEHPRPITNATKDPDSHLALFSNNPLPDVATLETITSSPSAPFTGNPPPGPHTENLTQPPIDLSETSSKSDDLFETLMKQRTIAEQQPPPFSRDTKYDSMRSNEWKTYWKKMGELTREYHKNLYKSYRTNTSFLIEKNKACTNFRKEMAYMPAQVQKDMLDSFGIDEWLGLLPLENLLCGPSDEQYTAKIMVSKLRGIYNQGNPKSDYFSQAISAFILAVYWTTQPITPLSILTKRLGNMSSGQLFSNPEKLPLVYLTLWFIQARQLPEQPTQQNPDELKWLYSDFPKQKLTPDAQNDLQSLFTNLQNNSVAAQNKIAEKTDLQERLTKLLELEKAIYKNGSLMAFTMQK